MKWPLQIEWIKLKLESKGCQLNRMEIFESGYICFEYMLDGEMKFKCSEVDSVDRMMKFEKELDKKYNFSKETELLTEIDKQIQLTLF